MKKELFSLLLSAVLLVSATACNRLPEKNAEQSNKEIETSNVSADTTAISELYTHIISPEMTINSPYYPLQSIDGDGHTIFDTDPKDFYICKKLDNEDFYLVDQYPHDSDLCAKMSNGKDFYLYVVEWDEFIPFPENFIYVSHGWRTQSPYSYGWCEGSATVYKNQLYVFIFDYDKPSDEATKCNLLMLKYDRVTKETTQKTIRLPKYYSVCYPELMCNMVDESTGFVSILDVERIELTPGDAREGGSLKYLLKTHDGGENWEIVAEPDNLVLIVYKSSLHPAVPIYRSMRFFNEETGMLVATTSYGTLWDNFYITIDGGRTWTWPEIPFNDFLLYNPERELSYLWFHFLNCVYENNLYLIRFRVYDEHAKDDIADIQFSSEDLVNWTLME